jgi:hypothetical protein
MLRYVVEGRKADRLLILGVGFEREIEQLVKRKNNMVLLSSHSN